MKVDEISKDAIIEIYNELKADNIFLSLQEIAEIIESQFIASNLAFKKGMEVRLPAFGTFVRKHGLEKSRAAAKLNELKKFMDKETFERKVLEAKLYNKGITRKRKKEMTRITFTELKKIDNLVNVKNKYDKLL